MPAENRSHHRMTTSARMKLTTALAAGVVAGTADGLWGWLRSAPLVGWDVLALVYLALAWYTVWPLDADGAMAEARREDPGRDLADLVLLGASAASLIAVGAVLFGDTSVNGDFRYVRAVFAVLSVFISWTLVHTTYTLKYARLYYTGTPGGIDFNGTEPPDYGDFAYLAFTIGMTFQVSDTDIQSRQIRRAVLKHAWISFPLLAVIIAASINLVSGLAN